MRARSCSREPRYALAGDRNSQHAAVRSDTGWSVCFRARLVDSAYLDTNLGIRLADWQGSPVDCVRLARGDWRGAIFVRYGVRCSSNLSDYSPRKISGRPATNEAEEFSEASGWCPSF